MNNIIKSIQPFFTSYVSAYLSFDIDKLLKYFHFPSIIYDLSGVHLLNSTQSLLQYKKAFLENLQKQNINEINFKITRSELSINTPNAVNSSVSYQLFNSKRQIVFDFDYNYFLIKQAEKWKILFASIGENKKILVKHTTL